jgi:hypothetical protein
MLETETAGRVAWELWRLARASGRTPWETMHDPRLAYNVTVMRAHDEYRRWIKAMRTQPPGDALGALLVGIHEDA